MPALISRRSLLFASCWLLLVGLPGRAQPISPARPDFIAGNYPSCQALMEDCALNEADLIIRYGNLDPGSEKLAIGTCYVHSKESCPDCACEFYVKESYRGGQNGFDGGTGCVGGPNANMSREESRKKAAELLKMLCESGACCCPQVEPKPCSVTTPVYARDPITGSCCTFPNPCSAPPAWKTGPDQVALCH